MSHGEPLHIAVVLQTPKDPQSAIYIGYEALAACLEREGHSLEIVAPADFGALRSIGGRWIPLVYPLLVAGWLRRKRRRLDLVVFHSYAGWLASLVTHGGPRLVVAFHGVEPLYHRELRIEAATEGQPLSRRYRFLQERVMPAMLASACRRAAAVSCLNEAEAHFLDATGWTRPGAVHVTPHGIAPGFFTGPRTISSVRALLFVGQWLPMKGVRYLREAATILLSRHDDLRLVCAGTLADAETVLAGFPPGLQSRVEVHPRIDQAALADLYTRVDAFVFPSLYEGFSRALAEAMAAGLPIVTTRVGVAADALGDGVSACIVPLRSTDAIVAAVERLRSDVPLANRLGAAAAAAAGEYHADARQRQFVHLLLETARAGRP